MSSVPSICLPSICIPRVNQNISKRQIVTTFKQLNLGILDRVDMIYKKNPKGEEYKKVFLHFKKWHEHDVSIQARQRLLEGKDIKIVYDFPWFWKASANRLK